MSYGAGGPRAQAIDGKCTSAKNVGRNTEIKLCIRTSMERGRWPRGVAVSARPSAAYRTSAEQAVVHHLHAVVRPLLLQYGYEQHASLGYFISALHSDGVCLSQLDAELLAEVSRVLPRARPFVLPPRLSDAEGIAHGGMVEAIGPEAIWNEYRREADTSGSDCHGRPNPAGGGRGEVSELIARSGLTRNLAEWGASDGCSLGTLHHAARDAQAGAGWPLSMQFPRLPPPFIALMN